MVRFGRRVFPALLAVVALGSTAALSGCDWLKGSEATQRSSPFLSDLSVSPPTVLCGTDNEFTLSFRYSDPQGDIAQAKIVFEREGDTTTLPREEFVLWPDNISRADGTAIFPFSFTCDYPGGTWLITVEVEDDRGHLSNALKSFVTLNAAG